MGFLSRIFVPRGVRRAIHPSRAVKRKITPKPINQLRRAIHPVSDAVQGVEQAMNTKPRPNGGRAPVYRHGSCTVNHRSPEAAGRCRRSY